MAEDFGAAWRALISARASAKVEVDPTHPLRLLYGVDDYGRALFFAISSKTAACPGSVPRRRCLAGTPG